MSHPITQLEILAALEANARAITDFFGSLSNEAFFDGDPDHWGPAHHIVHLTQANVSVDRALRSGALPVHSSARSRTYAEVRDAASTTLAATPGDKLLQMGRKAALPPNPDRMEIMNAFVGSSADLRTAAATWTEDALDRHTLDHPLMGRLTVREMLFFFVVHERHHLKSVRTRLGA